jgi:hypothetical protein
MNATIYEYFYYQYYVSRVITFISAAINAIDMNTVTIIASAPAVDRQHHTICMQTSSTPLNHPVSLSFIISITIAHYHYHYHSLCHSLSL